MFKCIIQIVSGSRSGSTLLRSVLAQSPSVSALDGEEEPYFKFCGAGYGLTSNSDEILNFGNKHLFRNCLVSELLSYGPYDTWNQRLPLQFKGDKLASLLNDLHSMDQDRPDLWLIKNGIYGMYDGCGKNNRVPFNGEMAYEMRPFVMPRKTKIPLKDTLIMKSPYNIYRPNIIEELFPQTEIIKVVMLRNPAAIINGLYDGWNADYGFHKHLTPYGWWKFDLPPGWEEYALAPTMEKCWFQFDSSYSRIRDNNQPDDVFVRFEELITNPEETINKLCRRLQIESPWKRGSVLPIVMSTELPGLNRWRDRAKQILPLVRKSVDTVSFMGYRELL